MINIKDDKIIFLFIIGSAFLGQFFKFSLPTLIIKKERLWIWLIRSYFFYIQNIYN